MLAGAPSTPSIGKWRDATPVLSEGVYGERRWKMCWQKETHCGILGMCQNIKGR